MAVAMFIPTITTLVTWLGSSITPVVFYCGKVKMLNHFSLDDVYSTWSALPQDYQGKKYYGKDRDNRVLDFSLWFHRASKCVVDPKMILNLSFKLYLI